MFSSGTLRFPLDFFPNQVVLCKLWRNTSLCIFSQALNAHLNLESNYEEVLGDQSMPFQSKKENSYCFWNTSSWTTNWNSGVVSKWVFSNTHICNVVVVNNLHFPLSKIIQGLFIFFFHCVFNKEVRKHLKNTLTGKKPLPDDSTATRATLLTVRKKHWEKKHPLAGRSYLK